MVKLQETKKILTKSEENQVQRDVSRAELGATDKLDCDGSRGVGRSS